MSGRCQSAGGARSDRLTAERRDHEDQERGEQAFTAWLRQKQHEAAERRRQQRLKNSQPETQVQSCGFYISLEL